MFHYTFVKVYAFKILLNVERCIVGVGREVLHSELQSIASPPDTQSLSYVYSVENVNALNGLVGRLIDHTCEKCGVSHMTDICDVIDDLFELAMTQQDFSSALNELTYIAQYLPANGQAHGQTAHITTIGDLGYRHTSISNDTDLDSLLIYIQSIRQQQSTCFINECDKTLALNILSGMIPILNITDRNNGQRNNTRTILILFSSGRFTDKSLDRLELQDALNALSVMETTLIWKDCMTIWKHWMC
ncbi:hypothetical protein DPMN_090809 [Dreissena polymorpha]|uniref:Uncharacterized protein n=1 Tax=Dreissena polymorpha TaxID=45954 RepID=A0A9D4QYK0_DREPO|nr:hypothetical protein DPMN_090809 [Dreissena polymorpha]